MLDASAQINHGDFFLLIHIQDAANMSRIKVSLYVKPGLETTSGKFHAFLSSADFFSKSTFSKNSFRNTI